MKNNCIGNGGAHDDGGSNWRMGNVLPLPSAITAATRQKQGTEAVAMPGRQSLKKKAAGRRQAGWFTLQLEGPMNVRESPPLKKNADGGMRSRPKTGELVRESSPRK